MNIAERVPLHAAAIVARLALPPAATLLLESLARIDLDAELLAERQRADEQNRKGVISWRLLVEDYAAAGHDIEVVERVVEALSAWGLAQVVGQGRADPIVPGSAAIRFSHAGRAALGLSPYGPKLPDLSQDLGEPEPWQILHGASREGLIWEARQILGRPRLLPHRVTDLRAPATELCGLVALSLLREGAVILDLFGRSEVEAAALLEGALLWTARARGPRLLICNNPNIARVAASTCGARLRWVELPLHGSQHIGYYDERVTGHLMAEHAPPDAVQADVCGMPESDKAIPRRVSLLWEDLLFAPNVRHQLDQALAHARFRTEILPRRPGFPGRGGGYRLLLSGVPGTGKSMSATALATALNRPLLTLDLSSVLSKWLGETERFLSQVFDMAEMGGCVLLLDEAEALFRGREGDEGGSGGGAIQTIVAFLLTRLEGFRGVLVATTNRVKDLDEAFFRRFDDFIVVPLPDPPTRLRMWRRMLGLDPTAPDSALPAAEVELIAERFAISGGLIRGAALRALAWAEERQEALNTPIVLAALARELEKNDRSASETFIGPHRERVVALLRGPGASLWD